MNDRVPNQREIKVNKAPADGGHTFTVNNLAALDEAAGKLTSLAGYKLYWYFAKNQKNYCFNLSSKAFCEWANCSYKAYTTAFEELVKVGYLVSQDGSKTFYTFYDKLQAPESIEDTEKEKEFRF